MRLGEDLSLQTTLFNGPDGLQTPSRISARAAEVAPATPPVVVDFALVGAATQDSIFRIGGQAQGLPVGELWRLDVTEQQWVSTPLLGEDKPGKILAATYRFSDQSIYAIDEHKNGKKQTARLFRIRRSGLVELLESWPRLVGAELTLSTSSLDEMVLSFSKPGAHAILVATVTPEGHFKPRSWTIRPGQLLAAPRLSEGWLTEFIQKGGKRSFEDIQREKFFPAFGPCEAMWW